jgi:hypothetical protein
MTKGINNINTYITNEVFMSKFELPRDEDGKLYWVPIVVRNKDYLLGFIDSYRLLASLYDIPLSELSRTVSSDRFNDVLYDGTRVKDLTKKQLKEKVKEMLLMPSRNEHIENHSGLYEENILTLDCPHCGMFYSFKNIKDIPEETSKCVTCGKVILLYTNTYDEDITYEGGKERIEEAVNDIHKDIFKNGEDD